MAINFPASLDTTTTLPNPTGTSTQASPDHASLHTNENVAIIAVETKVGTGASTPTNNNLLVGTGTGTSAWTKASPTGVIVGTTDSQTLTNKTLTTPTITGPIITNATLSSDNITGFTTSNSGTIYGVPVTLGVIQTANTVDGASLKAATVGSTALATNAVQANQVAANSITLASVSSSTSQGSISTSDVLVTGLTATVTIPAGGRKVRVEGYIPRVFDTSISSPTISLYNSATVTGTAVQQYAQLIPIAGNGMMMHLIYEYTPAAGSQSWCVALRVDAGTGSTVLSATSLAYLTIKVV